MRSRRDDSNWTFCWRVTICVAAALAMASGCMLGEDEPPRANLADDVEVHIQQLSSFCTVEVEGHGAVDVEEDYLPGVVACENGNAPMEALKAQAVAARTYAAFQAEAGAEPLADSEADQVYTCDYAEVEQRHIDAVRQTAGEVLVRDGQLIASFYVAGAEPSASSCVAQAGDADSTNTEQFVTYNEHKSGGSVQPTSLGHPDNPANRGAKSQNGATCLAHQGWDYERILRFYYGDDARAQIAEESQCVDQSADGGSSPTTGGDDVCGLSPASGDGPKGCVDPSQAPDIKPRSAWNARSPNGNRPHHTPDRITVHHTVTANEAGDGAAEVRNVQNIHMNQGWSDIGYHFLISWDGTIYTGNPVDRRGAHAGGDNTGNLGIALLGSFHQGVSPSEAQVESLARMLRYLGDQYGIAVDRSHIQGHGEWPSQSTACPGENLRVQLDDIVEMARAESLCGAPEDGAEPGGADADEYRYVRVTGIDEHPIPDADDNPVDGFEVDAIYGQRGSDTIHASSVLCSPGVNNANHALGAPANDSCDNRVSTVAGVPVGAELVVELSQPLQEGDTLNVVQNSYQTAMASCHPTGTAQIAVSKDGQIWKVLDGSASENWTRTLDADDFVFGDGDEAGDLDGFQFIAPKAGGTYTPDLTFRAIASNSAIQEVEYYVPEDAEDVIDDDWLIGSSTNAGNNYEIFYEFQYYGERRIAARGLDAQGHVVASQEIVITVTDPDGVIPEGEKNDTSQSTGVDIDTALASTIAHEGGRCYDPNDSQASGDRCQNGTGGWSSGLCWRFVKRALERAGIDWTHLQYTGPCSFNRFHLSAFGFMCNADPNPGTLAEIGLRRIDVPTTEAPEGAIIAWDRGCAGYNAEHGHIEISQGDGTACSDFCADIRTDASCASVYVPVN